MEQKYRQVFIEVFGVLESALNDDFSKDNVKEWDSVHQLNIVALLEEAFDIMFEPEDIMGPQGLDRGCRGRCLGPRGGRGRGPRARRSGTCRT